MSTSSRPGPPAPGKPSAPRLRQILERDLRAQLAAKRAEAEALAAVETEIDPAVFEQALREERLPVVKEALERRLAECRRLMREDADHRRRVFEKRWPNGDGRAEAELARFERRLALENKPKWAPSPLF